MKQWNLQNRWTFAVSIVLHAILLMSVYLFQGVILTSLKLFGLVPLLLPIVCTGVAVYQGSAAGGIGGIFAGILCDISFNQPAGLFTVLLTFSGLFVGALADTVIARGLATYFISCVVVLAVSAFAQMFTLMVFENVSSAPLFTMALQQTIYSMLFAFPIWFFVRALGKRAQRVSPSGRPL